MYTKYCNCGYECGECFNDVKVRNINYGYNLADPHNVYIGRNKNLGGPSPLANRYHIGRDGSRENVILKYHQWLRGEWLLENSEAKAELIRLCHIFREEGGLNLICHCSPKPCHGNIVRDAIIGIVKNNLDI